MRVPINWLSEYVDLKGLSDEEISTALTMSGTENEIERNVEFPGIVVGEIKEISAHPNADKVRVTRTDVGKTHRGILKIVCGAPNIEVGQKVPVALPGAKIGEFTIEKTKIRGVESNGMLCSESELGISDDHTGIMILDPRAKVGQKLEDVMNIGGTVLEAEITPNRSDCFSMLGIAREAAASLNRKLIGKKFEIPQIKSIKTINVDIQNKEKCSRYIAKIVEGVKIGPSPKWLQERLSSAGVRPINHVVDITNYVMLEYGQPMHAFDAAKISGKIIIRSARESEKLITLDGVERKLTKDDLVIADSKKAIALGGVMGGLNSEVTEKTTTIVLEAAVFNSVSVRKTAQRLGLRSEASNRFEKGIPLKLPEIAIERAANLLSEIPGGLAGIEPIKKPMVGENTDVLSAQIFPVFVGVRTSMIRKFLGVNIEESKVFEILKSLGLTAEKFDFRTEARKHLGKPYVYGAKYITHADMAFDCSYLTDFIYRKIHKFIGHTALAQYIIGKPVEGDLEVGDLLFYKSKVKKEWTDHYYIPDGKGGKKLVKVDPPQEVGHVGIYVGNDRVIHTRSLYYDEKNNDWKRLPKSKQKAIEESIDVFTKNPEYLGARRFVSDPDEWISVNVPWWRLDLKMEADILEEIGRMFGYERFPSTLPSGPLPYFVDNEIENLKTNVRQTLIGAGLNEIYTYSFVSKKLSEYSAFKGATVKVVNPINPEQEYMRTSLAGSLLLAAKNNQMNRSEIKLFEISSVYLPTQHELPNQPVMLGICIKAPSKNQEIGFFALKGIVELIFKKIGLRNIRYEDYSIPYLSQGQTAAIFADKKMIGYLGVITKKTKVDFSLRSDYYIAEIEIEPLLNFFGKSKNYNPISRYPEVERHYNFLVLLNQKASEIENKISKFNIKYLKSANIENIFIDDKLPEGKKSVTIRVVFGSNEKTLTDLEIAEAQKHFLTLVNKGTGGELRT